MTQDRCLLPGTHTSGSSGPTNWGTYAVVKGQGTAVNRQSVVARSHRRHGRYGVRGHIATCSSRRERDRSLARGLTNWTVSSQRQVDNNGNETHESLVYAKTGRVQIADRVRMTQGVIYAPICFERRHPVSSCRSPGIGVDLSPPACAGCARDAMKYGRPDERFHADRDIALVALPAADPVYGAQGPLLEQWS